MKKLISFFTVIFIAAFLSSCSSSKSELPPKESGLDSLINTQLKQAVKDSIVPGIFVAVLDNDQTKYFSAGYADPDKKIVFDSNTVVEIGSITKTFTALVLENVLKEKNISDSSSIKPYLPNSVQTNKAFETMSFLSLLNHSSGLPRLPENMDLGLLSMKPYDDYKADQFFSSLKNCTPKPNGKSDYSNFGAALAGVLAQRISGKNFSDLVNKYIFTPFGMDSTGKFTGATTNRAQGYFNNNKVHFWQMDIFEPAGGIKSSAKEMLLYLRHMSTASGDSSNLIIGKLLQPTINLKSRLDICSAWFRSKEKDKPAIYFHNGGTYGFSSFAAFSPGNQKAVFIVANNFNTNAITDVLGLQIMKRLIE